jgi:aldose 1-epimerase
MRKKIAWKFMRKPVFIFISLSLCLSLPAQRWTAEQANQWYAKEGWRVGCNFIPSTAINQLEMWQQQTFDPQTIDREMGWAQDIGMSAMRIFLHDLAYQADPAGMKQRMNTVLSIADKHGIKVAFVIFDDCWNDTPRIGKQPAPIPGVHNSGWMQSPGKEVVNNPSEWPRLEAYVKDILKTFGQDDRILLWDLYNEPGNSDEGNKTIPLLKKVYQWAREAKPSQPLSTGLWSFGRKKITAVERMNSDVITFHNYGDSIHLAKRIHSLKKYDRPLICTEWMARTNNSLCQTHLPVFKRENVSCFIWGLVAGKTNTIYPWGSKTSTEPPKVWFHDLFRADGTPYKTDEINTFKRNIFNMDVKTQLKASDFDTIVDGKKTALYFLKNKNGMEAAITNYGGKVVSLIAPDRDGKMADVVLGFSSIHAYLNANGPYFGALIGRYGNRIAKGRFTLDGKDYQLATNNNGINHLHGGKKGFNAVVWDAKQISSQILELTYLSVDGEEGYPGNLQVKVTYTLTDNNELQITYTATTDKATVINLTHHSFFNLQGEGNGTVNDHLLTIYADKYTPIDSGLIPTGEIADVAGTPFDFRKPKAIKQDINTPNQQLEYAKGYDHNFVLNANDKVKNGLTLAAQIEEPLSGRVMEVWTNEPGMQFYGGNFLNGNDTGKSGKAYLYRSAFCLETQHFPDSPNEAKFPTTVLRPGETYQSTCVYHFFTK